MFDGILHWIKKIYNKIIHGVAFVPALMVFFALLLAFLLNILDLTSAVKNNEWIREWFSLEDRDTARAIVTTVITGIIALTVFSFSMMMIVLNQSAGKLSNRLLDSLVGNKFQKIILGFYIGTIAFAFVVLSNITPSDDGDYIPSLSIYMLIILTMVDIFLFIYFLHFITESLNYGRIIKRIHLQVVDGLKSKKPDIHENYVTNIDQYQGKLIYSKKSGYYQSFNKEFMLQFTKKNNLIVQFLHCTGDYIIAEAPFFKVIGKTDDNVEETLSDYVDFYYGQEVDSNNFYGYRHLMEVAVKALSPGVNDPGTAALCIHSLTDILSQHVDNPPYKILSDEDGNPRIIIKERTIEDLFNLSIMPIWDYGKEDRLVQKAFMDMFEQINKLQREGVLKKLCNELEQKLKLIKKENI